MFINELNKDEAMAFINLVSEFALADKDVKKEEEASIINFCNEAGIKDGEIVEMPYEDAVEIIKAANERKRNIVLFELMGLGLSDGEYNFEEVSFQGELSSKIGITRSTQIKISNYYYKHSENSSRQEAEKVLV